MTPGRPDADLLTRLLRRTGEDPLDDARRKLDGFERFLRFHLTAWAAVALAFRIGTDLSTTESALRFAAIGILAVTVLAPPTLDAFARPVVAAIALISIAATFPSTSNHGFYGALLAVALVVLRGGPAPTTVAYLRATVLLVCFGAGLQKALHGTWWHGSYLAYQIGNSERFSDAMGWLLPAGERARLASLGGDAVGAGPYVLASWPALVASWAVVAGELAMPIVSLFDRLRRVAVASMLGLVVGFELVAHEVLFGGLFASLLALFFPWRVARVWLPVVAAVYVTRGAIYVLSGGTTW